MKLIKFSVFFIFSALFLGIFSGCKNKQKENFSFIPGFDTSRKEEFYIVGDLANFESLESVLYEFNKIYPNVNIIYEKVDAYDRLINKRLINDPSVGLYLGKGPIGMDLFQFDYDTSAFGDVINSTRYNEELRGIPLGLDIRGMMVNKTLFEKEGKEIPSNLDEFRDVCLFFREQGYIPIQQNMIKGGSFMFSPYAYSRVLALGDKESVVKKLRSGEKGCTEMLRPMFTFIDEDFKLGFFSSEEEREIEDEYDSAILNFFKGDVPFLPVSSDTLSGVKKRETKSPEFTNNPFEYEFCYMPVGKDKRVALQHCWRAMGVSPYSEHKEMSVEFLRFMGTKEMLNLLAQVKGIPSATKVQEDSRFALMNSSDAEYIYVWENKSIFRICVGIATRLGEYCDGRFSSIDELLEILVEDLKIKN